MIRRKPFELDPHLIHHVIHSQAGSIGKALIELIMNAVDAGSPTFTLTVTREGFVAQDAGKGFASEHEVENYFGRFGTPHQEGDATFGRFRLGRGQIMAHAKTLWESNAWSMAVDTKTMGYAYDLDDLTSPKPGCRITGDWYEPLETYDLHGVIQELRDLVRYTPLEVTLNGTVITRAPAAESWDAEDELAYYRLRREGAMAIYNQGVLVRHDPGQTWGVGGVVVTKRALDLNVSRTEILRKTCPTWKRIESQLKKLASAYLDKEGGRRQSESARALRARELMLADATTIKGMVDEKVFTLLPGLHHVSLRDISRLGHRLLKRLSVVPLSANLTRAENMAHSDVAAFFHPRTMERFECYNPEEFEDILRSLMDLGRPYLHHMGDIAFVPYKVLNTTFVEQTAVVPDKLIKDPETRSAWRCLKRALYSYIATVRSWWDPERQRWCSRGSMQVLVGESNTADAWTDGETYIALNKKIVDKLGGGGLMTAYEIMALVDHELAHEGDSLNAVHDEAFYARYHDLSLKHAGWRHHTIQRFLSHYSSALYQGQSRRKRRGWADRHDFNIKRINQLRLPIDHTLPEDAEHESVAPLLNADEGTVLARVNHALRLAGAQPDQRTPEEIAEAIEKYHAEEAARRAQEWANKQADLARADQVEQIKEHVRRTEWCGLPSEPLPDIPEDRWETAREELYYETESHNQSRADTVAAAWDWFESFLARYPDGAGDAALMRRYDAEREQEEWDQMEEEWAREANYPDMADEQMTAAFDDHFTPGTLARIQEETGVPTPTADALQALRDFHDDPEMIESFVRATHQWPAQRHDVWMWTRSEEPTLDAELNWTLVSQLAKNVGMSVVDYLAWRAEQAA